MPRVTDEHRAAQRDRIQQAAMTVVRSKGLASLTMGDIIKESGLSAGAIYGYYKSKDELILDVAETVMLGRRDVLLDLAERHPVPPPSQALSELLRSIPEGMLTGGLLLQFWGAAATAEGVWRAARELGATLVGSIRDYLVAWLRQAGTPEDQVQQAADHLVPGVSALAQGYILQRSMGLSDDVDAYLASARRVLDGELAG